MSLIPSYIAHIDSDHRLSGSHSQFNYKITLPADYDRVAVLSASIPKTFYLVTEPSNVFTLTEGGTSVDISLTPGNYSIRSLSTVLQSLLNTLSPNGYTYAVSYPGVEAVQTGKITFSVTGNAGVQPIISFDANSTIYKMMGFNYSSSNQFNTDQLVSTNVCLLTINELFIKSNVVTAMKNEISDTIIASVNVINSTDFSVIPYQPTDVAYASKPFNNSSNNVFSFVITDNDDNILDFNGVSCNLDLVFYKFDDTPAMMKKDLLMKWYSDVARDKLAS